MTYGMVEIGF